MDGAPFVVAVLAAGAPPLVLWWGMRRSRPWLGLAVAAGLWGLGPWAVQSSVDGVLAVMRAGWLHGSPHDWDGLDQPARKALVDGIRTRLAHGKLIAGLPDIARGLGAAGVSVQCMAWGYRRWQARRQSVLDAALDEIETPPAAHRRASSAAPSDRKWD